jgi:hypothetical protein
MDQSLKIVPVQVCRTSEGWWPVELPSASDPQMRYVVMVCPWGNAKENICECAGYTYRGECRHQVEAMDALCGWSELHEPKRHVQTDEQRTNKVCPRCGGPTKWTMEVVSE